MSEDIIDVALIIGSDSDWPYVKPCVQKLKSFGLRYDVRVISAHRTPDRLVAFLKRLPERKAQVVVAAAGWSAALAGMVAAHTALPVVGVPIPNSPLNGMDSILSTLQMPSGVPVATMSLGEAGASNAGIYAARIIALSRPDLRQRLVAFQAEMEAKVEAKDAALQSKIEEAGA